MGIMGLGLAALGRPGYINLGHAADVGDPSQEAMERRCHQVLDAAWAAGVRYFDAARSYGRAEEFLGSWLAARGIEPGTVTVASKWGYSYTAGWRASPQVASAEQHEVKDHSVGTLRRQIIETTASLGPFLSRYQIHSVTPDSPVLADEAVLDELHRMRDSGTMVGLTVSGPRQAEVIERALALKGLFGCLQATWNLHERSCQKWLAAAHDAGLSVVVKEALANGRLAREAPPRLAAAARELGVTPDAVALAAALAQPWADVVLSGAVTVAHLDDNLRARELRLDEKTLRSLSRLEEKPEAYWATRSRMPWN